MTKHGYHGTPEYAAWQAIKARCLNANHPAYQYYGARGITVCEQWINSFENFLAEVGPRPSALYSIDRVNNDGNYEPGNVGWRTRLEQQANRRNTIRLEFQGKTLTTFEASQLTGIPQELIRQRLEHGWSVERALSEPYRPRSSACVSTETSTSDLPSQLSAHF